MPDLPRKKVGLIACSGEELATGTLSRVAVRLVLEELRPQDTVTLCLPLFLAGEKEERAFARFYPTIAVDGCHKWCAKRATGTYSAPVADAVRVDEVLEQLGLVVKPAWRRTLDAEGWQAARALAEVIAGRVDAILGVRPQVRLSESTSSEVATCSCGSGIPVQIVDMGGRPVEVVALPIIFAKLYDEGKRGDAPTYADELLRTVRIYNPIPAEEVESYRAALVQAYHVFLQQRTDKKEGEK